MYLTHGKNKKKKTLVTNKGWTQKEEKIKDATNFLSIPIVFVILTIP